MGDQPAIKRINGILETIEFHPNIWWEVMGWIAKPEDAVQVEVAWKIEDPARPKKGTEVFCFRQVELADTIMALHEPALRAWLLNIHEALWVSVAGAWSQPKPRRHLRSVS